MREREEDDEIEAVEEEPMEREDGPEMENHYTPESAIEAMGCGKFQALMFVLSGLLWSADAMETMLLGFLSDGAQCEWALCPSEKALLSVVVFLGMLSGAPSWGFFSDLHGRRKAFGLAVAVCLLAALLSAAAPAYAWLLAARFFVGFGIGGAHIAFGMCTEWLPNGQRGPLMIYFSVFWTLGGLFEVLLAWLILPSLGPSSWRGLLAVSALPLLLLLLCYPLFPESPRFLYATGRHAELHSLFLKVSAINRAPLPGLYPLPLHSSIESSSSPSPNSTSISASNSTSGSTPIPTSNSSSFSQADNPTAWSRVKELFGRKLRKRTILLILVWFADAAIYYGAYLLVNEIFRQRYSSGDSQPATCGCQPPWTNEAFLTIVLSSLGELPGMVAAAWLLERIGRTWTQTVAFYLTGAMALLLILPSGYRADVVLFFVLRSSINSAFQTTFLASSELYPTRVRSTALGTLSAISRLGAMVAPLISQVLVVYSHSASLALYALFAFASGSLVIFLPETMGRSMVE